MRSRSIVQERWEILNFENVRKAENWLDHEFMSDKTEATPWIQKINNFLASWKVEPGDIITVVV